MRKKIERNCINCDRLAWWDGDYCCIAEFWVMCPSPNGEFQESILNFLEKHKNCKNHRFQKKKIREMYEEAFNKFLNEYESKDKENKS